MSTQHVSGKTVNIKRPAALIFSAFSDLTNFRQLIPAEVLEKMELDSDRVAGTYKGIALGAEIIERIPFSKIVLKEYKTKFFPFRLSICLYSRTDQSTDFHVEVDAELNPIMRAMVGGQLQKIVDDVTEQIAKAAEKNVN